jgi:hypothetical protein
LEGEVGTSLHIYKQVVWTYSRLYWGYVDPCSAVISVSASACTDKEIFCTAQKQAGSLHFSSLARHPSEMLLLHWVEGISMEITLLIVPPLGRIFYSKVYIEL